MNHTKARLLDKTMESMYFNNALRRSKKWSASFMSICMRRFR